MKEDLTIKERSCLKMILKENLKENELLQKQVSDKRDLKALKDEHDKVVNIMYKLNLK